MLLKSSKLVDSDSIFNILNRQPVSAGFHLLNLACSVQSIVCRQTIEPLLAMLGVGDKQIQAMQARSVRQHVDLILKNEGVEASIFVNQDELVLRVRRDA